MSKERTVVVRTTNLSVEAGEAAVGARPATVASDETIARSAGETSQGSFADRLKLASPDSANVAQAVARVSNSGVMVLLARSGRDVSSSGALKDGPPPGDMLEQCVETVENVENVNGGS